MKSHWHCVFNLNYHLVLVTKYRKKCLTDEIRERLGVILSETLEKWECSMEEFNGEDDHVHLLVSAHPSLQLSKLVNSLKTVSSRLIRKEQGQHFQKYYSKPVLWTRAYCITSTGGAALDIVKKYIEDQRKKKGDVE